ncbi:MAG: DUF411 domain-containing protein [Actinomycetota bacterium]
MRRWLAAGGAAAVLAMAACGSGPEGDAMTIEVHSSPSCDCCSLYEEYLAGEGFTVEPVVVDNPAAVSDQHGVPAELGSCHVSIVDGYFVEGHVPVDAVRRLLDERPEIDGISLPGMPAGTPGMPGEQEEPWVVYAVDDGEITEFARY